MVAAIFADGKEQFPSYRAQSCCLDPVEWQRRTTAANSSSPSLAEHFFLLIDVGRRIVRP